MKTFVLWSVLFFVLISTIIFLLLVRSDFDNPLTPNSVIDVATTSTPMSFDQATVYTCGEGSVIALAYKTGDSSVVELSVPVIGPVMLTVNEGVGEYSNNEGYRLSETAGIIKIIKDGEVLYTNCASGTKVAIEELATTTSSLAGTKWQWVETTVASGAPTRPNNPDDFIVTFATENRFSANTDCNNIGGEYTEGVNGAIAFFNIIATEMACEGDIQEGQFIKELEQVIVYTMSGNELALSLKDTNGTMKFTKQ